MSSTFDSHAQRQQFPSLRREEPGGPAIFLDGPGGTQTPRSVMDAMRDYLLDSNSNSGGVFSTSRQTSRVMAEARQAMADFFNARRPEEIAFGQNMTSLTFAMSRSISRTWSAGDEIIVTRLDHDANISPWLMAAAEQDVRVRWLDFNPTDCTLDLGGLGELLSDKTRLVAVSHASNAVGTVVDVARVTEMAHRAGAMVYVDAVHYAPHGPIDVQALDCDFLVASAYKFFGPHTGVLYGKYEWLESLQAYKVGAASEVPPEKWETGTQSFESLAGVTAAVDYLAEIGKRTGTGKASEAEETSGRRRHLRQAMTLIGEYERSLSHRFLEAAASVPGLRVYGITDVERLAERVPTFAVKLEDHTPRSVAERLGQRGIFVWDGHYFAVAVMERLGLLESGGLVRIGFVHYNTMEELERTLSALKSISAGA